MINNAESNLVSGMKPELFAGDRTTFQGWQERVRSLLQLIDSLQHVLRVGSGGRVDPEAPERPDPLAQGAQILEIKIYNGLLSTYRSDLRAYNNSMDEIGTKRNKALGIIKSNCELSFLPFFDEFPVEDLGGCRSLSRAKLNFECLNYLLHPVGISN